MLKVAWSQNVSRLPVLGPEIYFQEFTAHFKRPIGQETEMREEGSGPTQEMNNLCRCIFWPALVFSLWVSAWRKQFCLTNLADKNPWKH